MEYISLCSSLSNSQNIHMDILFCATRYHMQLSYLCLLLFNTLLFLFVFLFQSEPQLQQLVDSATESHRCYPGQ